MDTTKTETKKKRNRLRVFHAAIFCRQLENRQCYAIVAANSWTQAAKLFEVNRTWLRDYGSETGNRDEIAIAMMKPYRVFFNKNRMNWPMEWKELPLDRPA